MVPSSAIRRILARRARRNVARRQEALVVPRLRTQGALVSTVDTGATGGYCLASTPDELPLSEIVSALEGKPLLTSCDSSGPASHHGECGLVPVCPIRSPLHRIRESLWELMQKTTLRSLVQPRPLHVRELALATTEAVLR